MSAKKVKNTGWIKWGQVTGSSNVPSNVSKMFLICTHNDLSIKSPCSLLIVNVIIMHVKMSNVFTMLPLVHNSETFCERL